MATRSARDQALWVKEVQYIADGNPNQNSISIAGDVLVFIHGYNNGLDIIMQRQRQLAKDLEAVFGYFPVLRERADQRAGSLSGGEQQMLSISRALMARPRLMLLDEPSLGLSPKLVKDIFDIVVRINRELGVTILLVEQNANMALQTADFGYVLEVGRIVMADTCERLMQKEDIKEFYLGIKEQGARGQRRWKKRKTWR